MAITMLAVCDVEEAKKKREECLLSILSVHCTMNNKDICLRKTAQGVGFCQYRGRVSKKKSGNERVRVG